MFGLGIAEIAVLAILGLGLLGITMLVLRLSQRDDGRVAELERENERLRRKLDDKAERPE